MKKIFLACAFFLFSSSAFAGYVPLSVSQSYVSDGLAGGNNDMLLSTVNFRVMGSEFPEGLLLSGILFIVSGRSLLKIFTLSLPMGGFLI